MCLISHYSCFHCFIILKMKGFIMIPRRCNDFKWWKDFGPKQW